MKRDIEAELEKLDASLHNYNQMRNTEAVNRLAMLSLILGAGAVMTGFFGMNFGEGFERVFFHACPEFPRITLYDRYRCGALAFAAIAFGIYVVASNWTDYRDAFRQTQRRKVRKKTSVTRPLPS